MTLHPPLASIPLKRTPLARGKRAPRKLSIVDVFSQLPSQGSVAGSVVPPICHRALVAARTPLAVSGEDARNDSTHATTPREPAGVGTAEPLPRCGVRAW